MSNKQANIIVVCGGSGSGKSAWVKKQIKNERRVLIWDVNDEYQGVRVTNRRDLINAVKGNKTKTFRIRYVPPVVTQDEFSFWCEVAFIAGNLAAVAEETADVTSPSKAPPGWGKVVRRGRHQRLKVYGITQRPAESDKTIIGNKTLIHCCMLKRAQDRAYMAKEMDVSVEEVADLKSLEWIEVSDSGQKTRGKLTF
ncbi:MAG: ATP-binding protein [Candidatus Thiodiazotropha endolucinida]|uniref:ATP-binding protein n=1 Tax=Candidatus Thiodiazotropha taylori TaxID=2792791 RepID=A0A9E4NLH3_9GAMM|nr:ATP-binding protein [Candidatus Thiodiazotropha taylori]MCW4237725.1 ATP-binding protein [Candidatus Thiodiazotropha endolucinida]